MDNELQQYDEAFRAAMPGISPKALMEAISDPAVSREMAAAALYVEQVRLQELMKNPQVRLPDRLRYAEWLQKMSQRREEEIEEGRKEARPTIQIIFEGEPERSVSARPAIELDQDGDT